MPLVLGNPMKFETTIAYAQKLDAADPLQSFRNEFHIPKQPNGEPAIYFCGNSLGLQPKTTAEFVRQELEDWANLGVEGHFHARHPWMPYHQFLTDATAELVGAKPHEVVTMNSLTVNLHLMMVSFYRPTAQRFKILIEANAFPSDRYAVQSQLKFHGYSPQDGLLELPLRPGEITHRTEDILKFIELRGNEIALVLLSGVNYYTGQYFDIPAITAAAHNTGCCVGWDLAHAAGNIPLQLHNWRVDFAAWCSYKYLNAGPGSLSGVFVHERHAEKKDLPRFAGWWGHDLQTRFTMPREFQPMHGAEGWQLSNPPILPLAALRASLEIFQKADMLRLREKSEKLTAYTAYLLKHIGKERLQILTPDTISERGCQLSLVFPKNGKRVFEAITKAGVICDWREPDVIRIAPVPLYNTFTEVYRFCEILQQCIDKIDSY
jgi:kynureninase